MLLIFLKKLACSWAERSEKRFGTESERIKCYRYVMEIMEMKFNEAGKQHLEEKQLTDVN